MDESMANRPTNSLDWRCDRATGDSQGNEAAGSFTTGTLPADGDCSISTEPLVGQIESDGRERGHDRPLLQGAEHKEQLAGQAKSSRVPLQVLTHSSETTFKTCPRKFYLRYRLGLVPKHDSDALRIGSAYHAGLEAWKLTRDTERSLEAVASLYASSPCPPWLNDDEYETEFQIAAALVHGYAKRYADDLIVEHVAVELKFDLPIRHPTTGRAHETLRNQGKIDEIGRLPDGQLALIEHKTAGESIELGGDYWRRCRMDSQISRYYLAAHELGYPVSTVVYDVARKPQIRPKAIAKADRAQATSYGRYFDAPLRAACPERETPELFGARLRADIAERPDHYFQRAEIPRLESDLADFQAEQWQIAQQIVAGERYGRFYRNTSACTSPYRCTYFDVCSTHSLESLNESTPDGFKRADVLHPELVTQETV